MLGKIIIFILFLCPLIFFHELGHFLFARLFGVRVETFSIGFGPKILRFVRNRTEYTLSLIPLGGYIKMFGDDPLNERPISEEEKKYAFNYKSKWARFWIVFGGPLANLVLAYIIFFFLLVGGEKVPLAKFGMLTNKSFLYEKGIRGGDILYKINGQSVQGMTDITLGEKDLVKDITIKRSAQAPQMEILVPLNVSFKIFMDEFFKYPPRFLKPLLVDARGNRYVLSEIKEKVQWTRSLNEIEAAKPRQLFIYRVRSGENIAGTKAQSESSALDMMGTGSKDDKAGEYSIDLKSEVLTNIPVGVSLVKALADQGFYTVDLQVEKIQNGSAAEKAGLKGGDLLIALNNRKVFSFDELRDNLQIVAAENKGTVTVQYYRNTSKHEVTCYPDIVEEDGKKVYKIGVFSAGEFVPLSFVRSEPKGIVESLYLGLHRTWGAFAQTVIGVKKLISNEVSFKNVGGPIAIGKVASDSYYIGLSYFFKIMAVISVNLAVINLFPIPVLDGGHILFLVFEFFNRGPLSRKKQEMAQRFGVTFLLLLIFAAIFNDISRLFN